MAQQIADSGFLTKTVLTLTAEGIVFRSASGFSSVRKFSFRQIDLILMAPDRTLSFQVGREVFSIKTKPEKKSHAEAIEALLQQVRQSA